VVADIVQNVPSVTDKANQFVKDFEANNTLTLTPAMAVLPVYVGLGLTPDDIRAEPGGTLTIPRPPTVQQQLIHVMPELFKVAREQVTRLIGLVAIPNSELEKADDDDQVQEASFQYGKQLLRRAYIDQAADLLVASWAVVTDQFAQREDLKVSLGELPFLRTLLSMDQNRASQSSTETPQEDEADLLAREILRTEPDDSPTSSISSPTPTAGTDAPLSTASPGASSST
jgi:hypothetical protein